MALPLTARVVLTLEGEASTDGHRYTLSTELGPFYRVPRQDFQTIQIARVTK